METRTAEKTETLKAEKTKFNAMRIVKSLGIQPSRSKTPQRLGIIKETHFS